MTRKVNVMRTLTVVLVVAIAVIFAGNVLSGRSVRADAVTGTGWSYEDGVLTISSDDAFEAANARWKQYSNSITEIVLDNSITVIPEGAFASCSKLQTINLGHVTNIGDTAFNELHYLENVDLSSAVEIGDHAFTNCKSLSSLSLTSAKTIGPMAFYYCQGLKSVVLGSSIETIEARAFGECKALETINLSDVKTIKDGAFFKCEKLTLADLSAASFIGEGVFQNCSSLSHVVLGENLTEIPSKTFLDCTSLEDVDLSYVETVGDYAFSGCASLSEVTMGEDLTTLGDYAFDRCSALRSIDLTYVTSLGNGCFYECSNWDEDAQQFSGLETVILGEHITIIPEYAFYECGALSSINLEKVEIVGDYTFNWCMELQYADLSSVSWIGNSSFEYCVALSDVDLSSVESFGTYAFYGCEGLNEADLSSAKAIGYRAFAACELLSSITISNQIENFGYDVFVDSPVSSVYFIGSEKQYYDIFGWFTFDSEIVTFSAFDVYFYTDNNYEPYAIQTVNKGDTAVMPEDPESSGIEDLVFTGWFFDRSGMNAYDFDIPVTENLNLYACWMKTDDVETNVFKGHTLSLGGSIGVNFYTVLPENVSEDAYMKFAVADLNQEWIMAVSEAKTVSANGVTYTIFSCGVPAKNMTSVISAELIDNNVSIATDSYSVQQYAGYIMDHSDDFDGLTVQLVEDMINFGSAAQNYFKCNTDHLACEILPENKRLLNRYFNAQGYYFDPDDPYYSYLPEGLELDATSLSLKSDTIMNLYFTDSEDREVTYTCDGVEIEVKDVGGRTMVQIAGIPAHKLRSYYEIEVHVEGDENEYFVKYSPCNYCFNVISIPTEENPVITEELKQVMRFFFLYSGNAESYIQ